MPAYKFFQHDPKKLIVALGREKLLELLKQMLLIRNFEVRAESGYLQGKVGGFFHSYMGQEAIQTAAVAVMGTNQWWITSYRCHALALLLGATPNELMAELYGRATGNALGRGGSMHFFTSQLLGGFGIVGGQIPIATGAAFAIDYRKKVSGISPRRDEQVAICFLGDGAVAQGSFHESLNLASLWKLPCIYVIENNQWGMGTGVKRAVSVEKIAEVKAPSYGMKSYTLNGMDLLNCYDGFAQIYKNVQATSEPVLVEAITERFRGHSISDPALYRSKEELSKCMEKDPIALFLHLLYEHKFIDETLYKQYDKEQKEIALAAMKYADESPWPDPIHLEEDVFAPSPWLP